jgi:hypothetical protein
VWITGLLGRRYVGWEQVDGFELVPFFAYFEVRVKLKSGDLVRTGLVHGRRTYWQGGRARTCSEC